METTSTSSSAAAAVAELYDLTQGDVDNLFTLATGLVTVDVFILMAQLLTLGVLLALVFVIALRRF